MSDPIDPAVPDELRERIRSKSLSLVVSAYNSPQYGLATIAYETADELLDLFTQYAREEKRALLNSLKTKKVKGANLLDMKWIDAELKAKEDHS